MSLYAELENVVRALDEASVPHALCGGLAVAVHGHVRATKDIDLVVLATDVDRAKKALREAGFVFPALPMTFDAGTPRERTVHRVSKIVEDEPLTVDLIVAAGVLESVWSDRQILEWRGRSLAVVSRAGLARMKRLAGRDQDLLDLKRLGLPLEDSHE